jgi:hypothetical protein
VDSFLPHFSTHPRADKCHRNSPTISILAAQSLMKIAFHCYYYTQVHHNNHERHSTPAN